MSISKKKVPFSELTTAALGSQQRNATAEADFKEADVHKHMAIASLNI